MAILPMNHPADHQESMFEAEPEAGFEPEANEPDADHADFRDLRPYSAEEMTSVVTAESVAFPEETVTYEPIESESASEPMNEIQYLEPELSETSQSAVEIHAEAPSQPETLSVLSVNEFAALEERVLRAVALVRHEREARTAAEQRTALLESQLLALQADTAVVDQLQQEVDSLRAEREQVRQRVDRLLSQLDALEL